MACSSILRYVAININRKMSNFLTRGLRRLIWPKAAKKCSKTSWNVWPRSKVSQSVKNGLTRALSYIPNIANYTVEDRKQIAIDYIKKIVGDKKVRSTITKYRRYTNDILLGPRHGQRRSWQLSLRNFVECTLKRIISRFLIQQFPQEAIGADRVIAVHINNGFMRKNESENVLTALENIGMKLKGKKSP